MGKDALARKLTIDTGVTYTPQQAARFLDQHKRIYETYWDWVADIQKQYRKKEPLITKDGWPLFCDNPRPTSVGNFPVQATGATILRRAVAYLHQIGLQVAWPLHDGIYVESTPEMCSLHQQLMQQWMTQAVVDTIGDRVTMGIDFSIHTPDEIWIEEGAEELVERYSKYVFETPTLKEDADEFIRRLERA
jgi:hypothetical protein